MRECFICMNETIEEVDDILLKVKNKTFMIKCERCNSCSEEFPYGEETQNIPYIKKIKYLERLGLAK